MCLGPPGLRPDTTVGYRVLPHSADPGGRRSGMAEVKFGELRSVVEAVRQIVLDWDGFVSNVEALAREHDEYRQTADRLAWELAELRAAHERLTHEHEQTRTALASIQPGHEVLTQERAHLTREVADVQERHEVVLRERHRAGEELEAILRRFRASA